MSNVRKIADSAATKLSGKSSMVDLKEQMNSTNSQQQSLHKRTSSGSLWSKLFNGKKKSMKNLRQRKSDASLNGEDGTFREEEGSIDLDEDSSRAATIVLQSELIPPVPSSRLFISAPSPFQQVRIPCPPLSPPSPTSKPNIVAFQSFEISPITPCSPFNMSANSSSASQTSAASSSNLPTRTNSAPVGTQISPMLSPLTASREQIRDSVCTVTPIPLPTLPSTASFNNAGPRTRSSHPDRQSILRLPMLQRHGSVSMYAQSDVEHSSDAEIATETEAEPEREESTEGPQEPSDSEEDELIEDEDEEVDNQYVGSRRNSEFRAAHSRFMNFAGLIIDPSAASPTFNAFSLVNTPRASVSFHTAKEKRKSSSEDGHLLHNSKAPMSDRRVSISDRRPSTYRQRPPSLILTDVPRRDSSASVHDLHRSIPTPKLSSSSPWPHSGSTPRTSVSHGGSSAPFSRPGRPLSQNFVERRQSASGDSPSHDYFSQLTPTVSNSFMSTIVPIVKAPAIRVIRKRASQSFGDTPKDLLHKNIGTASPKQHTGDFEVDEEARDYFDDGATPHAPSFPSTSESLFFNPHFSFDTTLDSTPESSIMAGNRSPAQSFKHPASRLGPKSRAMSQLWEQPPSTFSSFGGRSANRVQSLDLGSNGMFERVDWSRFYVQDSHSDQVDLSQAASRSMVDLTTAGERRMDNEIPAEVIDPTETFFETEVRARRRSLPDIVAMLPPYSYVYDRPGGTQIVYSRQDEGQEDLPDYSCAVHIEAYLPRKMEFTSSGVQATNRSWKRVYVVLHGTSLKIFKYNPADSPSLSSGISDSDENAVHVHIPHSSSMGSVKATAPRALWGGSINDPHLLKAYSLQNAESGLAADYTKRKNVIRVRAEGEQFLLHAGEVKSVVDWIEALQAATNISLDLEARVMPQIITLPRRRRRRRPVDNPNSPLSRSIRRRPSENLSPLSDNNDEAERFERLLDQTASAA